MDVERDIIICGVCKGEGIVHKEEVIDGHNCDYESWDECCPACKGSGRLLRVHSTSTKLTPYIPLVLKG